MITPMSDPSDQPPPPISSPSPYGLSWPGKAEAISLARAPSEASLAPLSLAPLSSEEGAPNMLIRGDNLEALKALQVTHTAMIKMIYIDPPYNTRRPLSYHDHFAMSPEEYRRYLAPKGESLDREDATHTAYQLDGRHHTRWLNMMYPRLWVARSLLREDGLIFVSIDDVEVHNLRHLMDEIYGPDQFITQFVWETKRAARGVPPRSLLMSTHEYVLCYAINRSLVRFKGLQRDPKDFQNPDNDPRGPWRSESMKATGNQDNHFTITDPVSGREFTANWAFSPQTLQEMITDDRVIFPPTSSGVPRQKKLMDSYRNPTKACVTALGWHSTERATRDLMKLFDGEKVFSFPKPLSLLRFFCEQCLEEEDIILDFFAGSGSTGHAVISLNADDHGQRRFILIQRQEPLESASREYSPPLSQRHAPFKSSALKTLAPRTMMSFYVTVRA